MQPLLGNDVSHVVAVILSQNPKVPRPWSKAGPMKFRAVSGVSEGGVSVSKMRVSIDGSIQKWWVYNGKSNFKMDNGWGYPHFSKPPNDNESVFGGNYNVF